MALLNYIKVKNYFHKLLKNIYIYIYEVIKNRAIVTNNLQIITES